jgi:hypothetical protein
VLGPQVLQVLQVLQGGARTRLRRLRMQGCHVKLLQENALASLLE